MSFDPYGSLLLEVPREGVIDRVWDGDPITLDPPCYPSLHALAEELRQRGIAFTFVIAPMRPGYLAGRDPDGSLLAEHRTRVRAGAGRHRCVVIDAHAALDMPEEAFFDAYHLKRDKAQKLTRYRRRADDHADRPSRAAAAVQRAPPSGSNLTLGTLFWRRR